MSNNNGYKGMVDEQGHIYLRWSDLRPYTMRGDARWNAAKNIMLPFRSTEAMAMGTAIHEKVIGVPNAHESTPIISPQQLGFENFRSKAAKETRDAWQQTHPDGTIVSNDFMQQIDDTVKAVNESGLKPEHYDGEQLVEALLSAKDHTVHGYGHADMIDRQRNRIIDLKTTTRFEDSVQHAEQWIPQLCFYAQLAGVAAGSILLAEVIPPHRVTSIVYDFSSTTTPVISLIDSISNYCNDWESVLSTGSEKSLMIEADKIINNHALQTAAEQKNFEDNIVGNEVAFGDLIWLI
jgi:hypothetical protein